jgi:hypothetical protein
MKWQLNKDYEIGKAAQCQLPAFANRQPPRAKG